MADVTPILIKDLAAQTTLSDTDYFIVGGADAKKITVSQMKEALGINELNTNISNLETSSDKVGVYTVVTNGSEQHSAIFKLPFEQGRPSFLIVGNIGTAPFVTLYTIANITNDLQDPISVNLGGTPTGLVVWVNANLGDRTQLRIVFTTPEGMGTNLSVLAPGGRLIYSD